ncbi:hypothetical protein MNEG_5625 [Monoraphidium neglectum]|uniref:Uncharacterized protein n=1 Tax=Monoraphidium neglectum TaxID=145388 RepID=A0A0D2L5M9_9CHLO|nr:hypothetical protein MNEG_5625 [Monoraphidium neglectum]KIZ02329.1 hypothetical protein MNEG_5625 [Monoraphidium neglectum]|eukprot:XP_013901348.1 hypothetical protein MNEG_5625 [Monoraphidium neglectum]
MTLSRAAYAACGLAKVDDNAIIESGSNCSSGAVLSLDSLLFGGGADDLGPQDLDSPCFDVGPATPSCQAIWAADQVVGASFAQLGVPRTNLGALSVSAQGPERFVRRVNGSVLKMPLMGRECITGTSGGICCRKRTADGLAATGTAAAVCAAQSGEQRMPPVTPLAASSARAGAMEGRSQWGETLQRHAAEQAAARAKRLNAPPAASRCLKGDATGVDTAVGATIYTACASPPPSPRVDCAPLPGFSTRPESASAQHGPLGAGAFGPGLPPRAFVPMIGGAVPPLNAAARVGWAA